MFVSWKGSNKMRAVIQRVSQASVTIENKIHASVDNGLLVLACWEDADEEKDLEWMAEKITRLRVFNDPDGKMNLSLIDIAGEILVVSQFTLYASTRKGNRPSYIRAANPEKAIPLYERFLDLLEKAHGSKVKSGVFGADMKLQMVNDGPVTIMIDSILKE